MVAPYFDLDTMVGMIEEPNRTACQRVLADNRQLFQQAAGSGYNHQAWTGGYWDHITEAMNLWLLLYNALESTGRLPQLEPHERFTVSDGLLVLFWHDIEKPWAYAYQNGQVIADEQGRLQKSGRFPDKASRKVFAEEKLREYGVQLTPALRNAFTYVEGIRDADYSPTDRVMQPLAALCHACDMLSARMFHAFPLERNDAWRPGRAAAQ